jgi:hypothetical protein
LGAGACGDDSGKGSLTIEQNAEISVYKDNKEIPNGQAISVVPGSVEEGESTLVSMFKIVNVGDAPLTVTEISVAATPEGVLTLKYLSGPAPTAQSPIVIAPATGGLDAEPSTDPALPTYYDFQLWFERKTGTDKVEGKVTIKSNSDTTVAGFRTDLLDFPVESSDVRPAIVVSPAVVNFGNVKLGDTGTQKVQITNSNVGSVLEVSSFVLTGAKEFGLEISNQDGKLLWTGQASNVTSAGVQLTQPLLVPGGTLVDIKAIFAPTVADAVDATLILFSNDESQKEGTAVELIANKGGPCLAFNPQRVDFGGKLVGHPATVSLTLTSCGKEPVTITELGLVNGEGHSSDFSLDLTGLGNGSVGVMTKDQPPVEIGVDESVTFDVAFVPDEVNQFDETGAPVADLNYIRVVSDTFVAEHQLEVKGFGVLKECPTAIIKVKQGEEVIPQTNLELTGSQSFAANGTIAKYEWTVKQPPGSASVFVPSAFAPDPTFEANVAGTYTFKLRVWDQENTASCTDAEYEVAVNPDEAIHIELLWDTPNDPNQADEGPEAGADLDLHFLHQFATGLDIDEDGKPDGWFDNPYDCFWFNKAPNWGSANPQADDDPSLDRDDTDGAGPENVNLNQPENGYTYRVGTHYWNAHGFGPSFATVRVYINAVLVFEVAGVQLVQDDMWCVCTVAWPSGEVTPCPSTGGAYSITPNYKHPLFQ